MSDLSYLSFTRTFDRFWAKILLRSRSGDDDDDITPQTHDDSLLFVRIVTDVWPNHSVGSWFLFAARSVCKYKVCVQNKWNHVTCVTCDHDIIRDQHTLHSLSGQSLDFCS